MSGKVLLLVDIWAGFYVFLSKTTESPCVGVSALHSQTGRISLPVSNLTVQEMHHSCGCNISRPPWGSAHPTSPSINVRQKSVFLDREGLVLRGQLSKPKSCKTFDITDNLKMYSFCRWEKHTRKHGLDCNGKFIGKKIINFIFIMCRKMCIIFSKSEKTGLAHQHQQSVWAGKFNNV